MGDKRISTRTLPDGTKCVHHPPDDEHPEGKLTLIREGSTLKDRLDAQLEENQMRHSTIQQVHLDRIEAKKANQRAKGMPPEKSVV